MFIQNHNKTVTITMTQRSSGNEKEYLVCYTLYSLQWKPEQQALNKMNIWATRFTNLSEKNIEMTKAWLKKFDITENNPGTFNVVLDNMGTSRKQTKSTTADIIVFPLSPSLPIMFSIKNNNTFLKSPCPNAFPEQMGIPDTDFKAKYTDIMETWYDELQTMFGGRFPVKSDKMKYYTEINNLIKSFLITYEPDKFVKFILDINEENPDKYIIKYNKDSVVIYKIDLDMNQYKIVVGKIKNTFLYIDLVHKTIKMDPIQIQLRIKNYESFVRRKSKILPIKYSVTIRNLDRFICFKAKRVSAKLNIHK